MGQFGINNPNYKGKNNNKKCIDCSREVYPGSKRCEECFHKWLGNNQKGENNPNWLGGKSKCMICDKETNNWNNKYCSKKCFGLSEIGNKHHNYLGLTDLYTRIKTSSNYKLWRSLIYTRDNYTCKDCGDSRGGNLEAHHVIKFSIIFNEFLNLYSQFSPIEDKETLVRLALTYEPFWNTDNGKTLCKSCHKLTDNYGKKLLKPLAKV